MTRSFSPSRSLSLLSVALLTPTLMAAGCDDDTATGPSEQTIFGVPATLGGGTARTFVTLDASGAPTAVGIALTEGTLTGLPAMGAPVGVVLRLPQQVAPFDHVTVDYMPMGHDPAGVYSVPHFDMHFYLISEQQRDAILPSDPQFGAKGMRPLAAEFAPVGTSGGPGVVPRMGAHWGPTDAPEFRGQPFQRVHNYCVYDAQIVCLEPMIARSFLESKPDVTVPLQLPARYQRPGLYPASYSVKWDSAAREYRITLNGLTSRN
jgi:hypothetical protein